MCKGGREMWTIIDIKSGLIAHCETFSSAVALIREIKKGRIFKDDNTYTQYAIELARETWKNEC